MQDPGNVGALLRAAEAGGATGALVCGASANPFSWKALRGSMGSALRLPVVSRHDDRVVMTFMRCGGRRPHHCRRAARRRGSRRHRLARPGGAAARRRGPGLTDEVIARCDARVTIPMAAPVESLNVAVAGGDSHLRRAAAAHMSHDSVFDED